MLTGPNKGFHHIAHQRVHQAPAVHKSMRCVLPVNQYSWRLLMKLSNDMIFIFPFLRKGIPNLNPIFQTCTQRIILANMRIS